jgi:hypothetical protein
MTGGAAEATGPSLTGSGPQFLLISVIAFLTLVDLFATEMIVPLAQHRAGDLATGPDRPEVLAASVLPAAFRGD